MKKIEELQRYFNFTKSDLEENIKGRVTEGQKAMLKEKLQKEIIMIVGLFLVMGVIGLIILPSNKFFLVTMAVGFIVTLIGRITIKRDHSLDYAEGPVNFFWEEHKIRDAENYNNYTTTRKLKMKVGSKSFDVREDLMDILDQGDNCCFYFTGGGDIVSAEYLGKPENE